MALSNLGKNIIIGASAATSHMTSNKMGVYNSIPINGSVMIGNGQSICCTHKKTGCHLQTQGWIHGKRNLGYENCSTTQMNGRWKERGLIIELFKTTRASMKFDRMIPSGSSWLMGVIVQRMMDHAHSAIEPGKRISMSKFHQITGHTGDH